MRRCYNAHHYSSVYKWHSWWLGSGWHEFTNLFISPNCSKQIVRMQFVNVSTSSSWTRHYKQEPSRLFVEHHFHVSTITEHHHMWWDLSCFLPQYLHSGTNQILETATRVTIMPTVAQTCAVCIIHSGQLSTQARFMVPASGVQLQASLFQGGVDISVPLDGPAAHV